MVDMTELSGRGRAAYWVVAALAWAGVAAESLSSLSMLRVCAMRASVASLMPD